MLGTITLTVGQPDGVSVAQKEEAPETVDTIQDEVAPQVNGEKVEKESPDANDISAVEEKAAEEKPDDANEVGFKKIFRFVGFKFTLKKDKSEEKDPVKLLTVKDKEGEEVSGGDEPTKEVDAATAEEKSTDEEKEADAEVSTAEAEVIKDGDKAETTDAPTEGTAAEATDEAVKEEGAEKEAETTPPSQETTVSPFRKLFSVGLFSNLRKKASIKKTKEEEDKEAAAEEEAAKTEEAAVVEEKEVKDEVEQETKEEAPATPEEQKSEPKEEVLASPEEVKSETAPEPEASVETPPAAETTTDETKQQEEKAEPSAEEEKAPAEVISEPELLSSQEKAKPQGSPLKKLFTGAGLKKLSTKKQKTKKDTETKLTESGEQAAEQLQSSTESAEAPKSDSSPSSPEESGEHVISVEVTQNESSQETDGEVTSDGEKKKEGIIAWSSFKKLVTPKKRVKRPSESEDEATGEKPAKSATLSSSESAPLADKSVEEEEVKEDDKLPEEDPKTENTEKLVSSTEEPKKKMDTSVSWEALMCMGGPKKRTRKTSDSDDEETKIEEELPAGATAAAPTAAAPSEEGEKEDKTEAAVVTSQNADSEVEAVSPEPLSPPERESAWDTLKRLVLSKNKPKVEEKPEESAEQVQSDGEAPKDESSFSLRKFLPGRRKKKVEKQASAEQASVEEDSDTPAVVPLSEYDEQVEAKPEEPAEPAEPVTIQIQVSAEDRSPSWIPATVGDIDDKLDELSDIPEEAENVATPKSVDTDVAEDEIEEEATPPPKAFGRAGRRLSTAEVKPVTQAPAAETTPVPQGPRPESAEEIIGAIEAHVSEIPSVTSVTVEDVPLEVASEKTEYEPPTETAECQTKTVLEPHISSDAMAICTGLGTKEIAKVAVEKPAMPIVECMAVIHDALSTEVLQEEKQSSTEQAIMTEDAVLKAQVEEVETTELEPMVENSLTGVVDIQEATEAVEPEIEKFGLVSIAPEQSDILQPTTMSENSPKAVEVDPITPTAEAAICTQSVEINEPTIQTKEMEINSEQLVATEELTPVKEVVPALCETTTATNTKENDPVSKVVVSGDEVPVITETVILVAPLSAESNEKATSDAEPMPEPAGDEPTEVEEPKEEVAVGDTVEATAAEIIAVTDQASEKVEDVQQTGEIEAQSMVIAQTVIQDAVDKVSEDTPEPKKPTTPTPTIPEPVQAIETTEKEIELTAETPVITDTPVAVSCERTPQPLCVAMELIDTVQVEVTGTLDASEEVKKSEKELKKAVEVKVSEETVVVEEVMEMKEESQTDEDLKQVKEEQSKDDTEVQESDMKEPVEEVKPDPEETKIHMPVQVVLQTAKVLEEPSVEEEAVEEFDTNGPVAEDTSVKSQSTASEQKLSTLVEEPLTEVAAPSTVTEAAASQPETEKKSVKCAEVMAQVIEVIEEAVKEIEPVSTEITAAS